MDTETKHGGDAKLTFKINGKEYHWHHQYITGSEIRKLANISENEGVFLKIKEPWKDEPILNETQVDLARPGIEHFYSKKEHMDVKIIVNGREKPWDHEKITFEQVIVLAFGSYEENQNRIFTVTFKGGPDSKSQGTMVKGDSVCVKNKMIFNVTATDKS